MRRCLLCLYQTVIAVVLVCRHCAGRGYFLRYVSCRIIAYFCLTAFFIGNLLRLSDHVIGCQHDAAVKVCGLHWSPAGIIDIASDSAFGICLRQQMISFVILVAYLISLTVCHLNDAVERIIFIQDGGLACICDAADIASFIMGEFYAAFVRQNDLYGQSFIVIDRLAAAP